MFSVLLVCFSLISTISANNKLDGNKRKLAILIPINRVRTKCLKQHFKKTYKTTAIKCSSPNEIYSPDIYGLSLKNEEKFDVSKYLNK